MVDILKPLRRLDTYQRHHRPLAFMVAVVKKYGDDQAGYKAALLTYYGFLALFPLFLILTTLAQVLLRHEPTLRTGVIQSVTNYFPIVGRQLERQTSSGFPAHGWALVLGLLLLLYGARGAADALRHCLNDLWGVPADKQSGFWPALAQSLAIIAVGGIGFVAATVIAGFGAADGHAGLTRLLSLAISAVVLFITFIWIVRLGLNRPAPLRDIGVGTAVATIGLLILQWLGGYVVTHELKHLDTLYGTFAVVLGLLFWLYLQARLVVYAIEIDTVRVLKRWPRNLL